MAISIHNKDIAYFISLGSILTPHQKIVVPRQGERWIEIVRVEAYRSKAFEDESV